MDAGANVNATDIYGKTPLNVAASCGSLENIQNLLAAGADINIRGPGGDTPLHSAAQCYRKFCSKYGAYCEQGKLARCSTKVVRFWVILTQSNAVLSAYALLTA